MSTFVTVGNAHQSFSRLLRAVSAIIDLLPRPILVQHGHTEFAHPECDSVRFISRQQFEVAVRSDVMITHAGAGSLLESLWAGQMPIVMPRLSRFGEHIDDHQVDLAFALAQRERVIKVDDEHGLRRAVLWVLANPRSASPLKVRDSDAVVAIRRAIHDAHGRDR